MWALRMTRDLCLLPRCELAINLHKRFVGALGEARHFLVDGNSLIGLCQGFEFSDLCFQIGDWLFEIEIRLHPTARRGHCLNAKAPALLLRLKVAGKWRGRNAESSLA